MKTVRVLFVEYCDYESIPTGGQLSFIRALVANINVDELLAGVSTGREHLCQWTIKDVIGQNRPFFVLDRVGSVGLLPKIPHRIRFLLSVAMAKKRLLERKPDVIFAQSAEAALPFLIGSKRAPVVFRLAGANNPLGYSRFVWARLPFLQRFYENFVLKTVIRRASKVIAIDEDCALLCARMRGSLPPNWVRIPVAVDREVFHPLDKKTARRRIGHTGEYQIIICVGRLASVKGYDFAFDVFQQYLKSADARLFLVGDGEDRESLEEDAKQRGIEEKVIFWRSVSHEQLPWILNASDVFFMSSRAEGLPNALLEAMSCGLPVVATAVGGIPEVIEDGVNGFLLHSWDVDSACAKLAVVLDEPNDFGARGIQTIEERFSIGKVARGIEQQLIAAAKDLR